MASDSNIKKVTLEIGGEILRTKEWTEIDGYFETTEVGTGVWSVTYSTTKCFDGNLRGIPDWVFDENDDRGWRYSLSFNFNQRVKQGEKIKQKKGHDSGGGVFKEDLE